MSVHFDELSPLEHLDLYLSVEEDDVYEELQGRLCQRGDATTDAVIQRFAACKQSHEKERALGLLDEVGTPKAIDFVASLIDIGACQLRSVAQILDRHDRAAPLAKYLEPRDIGNRWSCDEELSVILGLGRSDLLAPYCEHYQDDLPTSFAITPNYRNDWSIIESLCSVIKELDAVQYAGYVKHWLVAYLGLLAKLPQERPDHCGSEWCGPPTKAAAMVCPDALVEELSSCSPECRLTFLEILDGLVLSPTLVAKGALCALSASPDPRTRKLAAERVVEWSRCWPGLH